MFPHLTLLLDITSNNMKYSIIVPVFNRPEEVDELLESLLSQEEKDFEIIIVEDGSTIPCEEICKKYSKQLDIHYFFKSNSGPGQSRNYGAKYAKGKYLLILDSDIIIPKNYLSEINKELDKSPTDAFGGPDKLHDSFSNIQKAISYSMTSFLTTGGIRGGKRKLDKFYPRSFNMGIRSDVYKELGGFADMRFGEDIDFSIRIFNAGKRCRLFPKAWVWHKRRTDFKKFWKQVYNSGIARINLYKKYPESLKIVHLLPMLFTIGVVLMLCLSVVGFIINNKLIGFIPIALLFVYYILNVLFSRLFFHNIKANILSGVAAYIQLLGYGCGFLNAWWRRCVNGKKSFSAYDKTFYK